MSNTSIRPIPTLRGMFSVPRVTQGRNFLRENKLSLRSLEKATTEKLAAKEPVRPKWMPPLRRTSSDARDPKRGERESEGMVTSTHNDPTCLLRTNSQQHVANPYEGEHCDGMEYAQKQPPSQRREAQPASKTSKTRCHSCGTERNATSIGIQTEDITDEIYLTNALKKCNFDGRSLLSGGQSIHEGVSVAGYDDNYKDYGQYDDDEQEQPLSARTNASKRSNCAPQEFNMNVNETMPLPDLNGVPNGEGYALDDEASLSARSRSTIGSLATTKSKRREHKLGSRDEVRLPRYLEKEKRNRAEAVQRELARDPDCPRGHVLVSEPDRLATLATSKQQFDKLISELNHMPMTAQTLRVRTRKAEIDKELTEVEEKMRVYSKPKVYVPITNAASWQ